MKNSRILTVILSGGASRRMGRAKAMLPYHGKTMLQYLIDKYSSIGDVAVSVNENGIFQFNGAVQLVDSYPSQGPLNGIVSAFSQTDADIVFLTGTDLPLGDPELALLLCSKIEEHEICCIKHGEKNFEPLFSVYKRSILNNAEEVISRGNRSFRQLLSMSDVLYLTDKDIPGFDLDRILKNINTPEDYIAIGGKFE